MFIQNMSRVVNLATCLISCFATHIRLPPVLNILSSFSLLLFGSLAHPLLLNFSLCLSSWLPIPTPYHCRSATKHVVYSATISCSSCVSYLEVNNTLVAWRKTPQQMFGRPSWALGSPRVAPCSLCLGLFTRVYLLFCCMYP